MSTALLLKIAAPLLLAGGCLVLLRCDRTEQPPHFDQRQTAMVDSLQSAAPSHKDLK